MSEPDGELPVVDYHNPMGSDTSVLPGNGLRVLCFPGGLEKIYHYEPGGHHPVHLGDTLHDRYKVIHKLGSGGYSNVWLCRDTNTREPRYVAVKIIMAEASTPECPELRINSLLERVLEADVAAEHFCLPLDQFSINGTNGSHYAFVYPVLGPRVSELSVKADDDDFDITLRTIARQVTQAMSTLHAHGICHADFRPHNILARISNLDGLTEEEVLTMFGQPETARVTTISEKEHDLPIAPQYLVYPILWGDVTQGPSDKQLITGKACVIDLGEAFETSDPPSEIGIPQSYCAPEYELEKKVGGAAIDLWALGCTIFEIRTGRRLFGTFDGELDDYLWIMALVLGKLPEPWWSETWEGRRNVFVDEVEEDGKVIEIRKNYDSYDGDVDRENERRVREARRPLLIHDDDSDVEPLEPLEDSEDSEDEMNVANDFDEADKEMIDIHGNEHACDGDATQEEEPKDQVRPRRRAWTKPNPRSLRESIKEGHFFESEDCWHHEPKEISDAEAESLADLLGKLLKYLPEERSGAAEVLEHPWFTM
ncbi:kinase-like domain-containing protein [Xylariomycetidae sp. FL2044]|nr:kinase-like domain-containing protein [Xylariomycetidae sp. FL2044]